MLRSLVGSEMCIRDRHDSYGFWGGKFGGSFIPETLKKPVEDLTKEFSKLSPPASKKLDKIKILIKIYVSSIFILFEIRYLKYSRISLILITNSKMKFK